MHLKNLTYDLETKLYWKCITVNNPHQELFLHEKVLYIWPAHLQSGASSEILILRSSIGKRYCEPNIDIEVVDETNCCCSWRTSRLGDGRNVFRDITNSDPCEKVLFWQARLEQLLWLTSSSTFWKAPLELITVNNNMAKEKISAADSGKTGRESEACFCQRGWQTKYVCQLSQNCIRTRRRSFHPRTTKEAHVPVSIGLNITSF